MKLRSSVSEPLLKKALFRGTAISATGVILLFIAGAFLPKALLITFGLPTLIISSMLIGYGLLPYRKLSRLQMRPHELVWTESHLLFAKEGKPLLKIPHSIVEKLEYGENAKGYGLKISLRRPLAEKISILQKNFDLKAAVALARTSFDCDLFLPYFTKKSVAELNGCYEKISNFDAL